MAREPAIQPMRGRPRKIRLPNPLGFPDSTILVQDFHARLNMARDHIAREVTPGYTARESAPKP